MVKVDGIDIVYGNRPSVRIVSPEEFDRMNAQQTIDEANYSRAGKELPKGRRVLSAFELLKCGDKLGFAFDDAPVSLGMICSIHVSKRRLTFEVQGEHQMVVGYVAKLENVLCRLTFVSPRGRLTFTPMDDEQRMPVPLHDRMKMAKAS